MDIVIISANNEAQAAFWQQRLSSIVRLITIVEDWPGGAGNGLGTLYAYNQAREKGKKLYSIDIAEEQEKGGTVAIYHTAGTGKRLYPLTGSEKGNKPAIKLPAPGMPTLLEMVVRQTSEYAPYRKGRLSVFWADQLFHPSNGYAYSPFSEVDILCIAIGTPKEEEWETLGLGRYGLLCTDASENTFLYEKPSFDCWKKLEKKDKKFFISLGSFSLSFSMTRALLEEFSKELQNKKVRYESDTHFWMPMTLGEEDFLASGGDPVHFSRMQKFKSKLSDKPLLAAIDIGKESFWWDFGTVQHYFENNMKLLSETPEGDALRALYKVDKKSNSLLIDCEIQEADVENSILVNVKALRASASDSLLINMEAGEIKTDNALAYNVKDSALSLSSREVRADIGGVPFYTELSRCGKKDWEIKLPKNPSSYSKIT